MNAASNPRAIHDDQLERAVLGAALMGEAPQVSQLLEPEWLHFPGHVVVLRAINDALARREVVDLLTIRRRVCADPDAHLVRGLDHGGVDSYLARMVEAPVVSSSLRQHCECLRELAMKRELLRHSKEFADSLRRATSDVESLAERACQELEAIARRSRSVHPLVESVRTVGEIIDRKPPAPASVLGDGLLCRGQIGMLAGYPRTGKTWAGLGLALSIARGEPWLGLNTVSGGGCSLYLALELEEHFVLERLRAISAHRDLTDVRDRLLIVARSALGARPNLLDKTDQSAVRRVLSERRPAMVCVDVISRAHTGDENDSREVGGIIGFMEEVAMATDSAILLMHHLRKPGRDGAGSANSQTLMQEIRGSGRWVSEPRLVMVARTLRDGRRGLAFAKANDRAEPAEIFFEIPEGGGLKLATIQLAARVSGKTTSARVAMIVREFGPLSRAQVQSRAGLSRNATAAHLAALVKARVVTRRGTGGKVVYLAPCSTDIAPDPPAGGGSAQVT